MAIHITPSNNTAQNHNTTFIAGSDTPSIDAFGRMRVSSPETIFDSKQLYDSGIGDLFWDDQETSGSGTSSSWDANTAATTLAVSSTTAGVRVRQTKMRFNYQPGKSHMIILTGVLGPSVGNIRKRWGYFDENNGVFFEVNTSSTLRVVRRTYTSGSPVDTAVAQSSWNLDTLDGTGPSGVTLDLSKGNIFFIDLEWLGMGRVRMGVVIDGLIIYCHQFLNGNALTSVYMSTPNLPIRWEIENNGSGVASNIKTVCSTVISEGGQTKSGMLRYRSTGGTHVDADAANSVYALVGVKLKSSCLSATVDFVNASVQVATADDVEWALVLNPTVTGSFTYADLTASVVQTARGATANTCTGGITLSGGFVSSGNAGASASANLETAIRLGSLIDGTADQVVLVVRPLSASADVEGALTWREYL